MLSFSNDVIWASLSATGKSAAALTAKTAAKTITNFMLIFGCSTLSLLNERAQLNDVDSEIAGVFYTDSTDGLRWMWAVRKWMLWDMLEHPCSGRWRFKSWVKRWKRHIREHTHTHSTQHTIEKERERNIHSLGTPATRTHIHTAISGNYGQFNRRPIAVSLTNNHFHAAMSTWYAQHICSLMKLTANHLWPKTNSMRCFCLRFVVCMYFGIFSAHTTHHPTCIIAYQRRYQMRNK